LGFGGKDRLYWKALPPTPTAQNDTEVPIEDLQREGAVRDNDKIFVWDTVTVESKEK
jgi:hypothetical protein